MNTIDGQLSLFDVLVPAHEVKLPFTVYSGPGQWEINKCAYCESAKKLNEGGGGPATAEHPAYRYNICEPCSGRYRSMRPPMKLWTFKEIS